MGLFPFPWKSKEEEDLASMPLFAELGPHELKIVRKILRLVEFKKGDFIYRQEDAPEAFYILQSGRLRAFLRTREGHEKTVAYFYRGDYFGEISILTDKPHSVSVEARNDALIYKIDKEEFKRLLKTFPSVALHLSRTLGTSLKERDQVRRIVGEAKIMSVISLHLGLGRMTFLVNLACALIRETHKKVVVVDLNPMKEKMPVAEFKMSSEVPPLELDEYKEQLPWEKYIYLHRFGFSLVNVKYGEGCEICDKKLSSLLAYLIAHFSFVLVKLPYELGPVSYKALRQSDNVYITTNPTVEGLGRCQELIQELKSSLHFSANQVKLVVSEAEQAHPALVKEREQLAGHKVFATLPHIPLLKGLHPDEGEPYVSQYPDSDYARVIRYLAREAAGVLVGLVLGSGAAHGLAHIGILKVLEREKIPVDIIAGSSIGALIGTCWSAGYNSVQIEEIALTLGNRRAAFLKILGPFDFSAPHLGFFKGKAVEDYLRELLGHRTFRDLRIPVRIIATNLYSTEGVIFEEGSLVDALRASISVPGIFRPVHVNDLYLVDGGVADPVPVDVLASMGVRKIIAVNVLPGPYDRLSRMTFDARKREETAQEMEHAKWMERTFFQFGEKFRKRYEANIFNVLMNVMQCMEYGIASRTSREADVVLNPVIPDASWIEFYSPGKFIKAGEREAENHLGEIKRLIEEF